jgi:hypothetical protein
MHWGPVELKKGKGILDSYRPIDPNETHAL